MQQKTFTMVVGNMAGLQFDCIEFGSFTTDFQILSTLAPKYISDYSGVVGVSPRLLGFGNFLLWLKKMFDGDLNALLAEVRVHEHW